MSTIFSIFFLKKCHSWEFSNSRSPVLFPWPPNCTGVYKSSSQPIDTSCVLLFQWLLWSRSHPPSETLFYLVSGMQQSPWFSLTSLISDSQLFLLVFLSLSILESLQCPRAHVRNFSSSLNTFTPLLTACGSMALNRSTAWWLIKAHLLPRPRSWTPVSHIRVSTPSVSFAV